MIGEMEGEFLHNPPAKTETKTQPLQLEATVGDSAKPTTATVNLETNQASAVAQKPEQAAQKPKEALTAAEKEKLKQEATVALDKLTKEADRIAGARDYSAALGIIFGQADLHNIDRIKNAYRERMMYFHPDKADRKVAQILGDVGKFFPDLADKAHTARLACENATKKLNEANSFLSNDGRRKKYLAQNYGIHEGVPAAQSTQKTEARAQRKTTQTESAQRTKATEQTTGRRQRPEQQWVREAQEFNQNSFKDWEKTYKSDEWQKFAQYWQDRQSPIPKAPESLLERMREGMGQRHLSELVNASIEAFKEVKDMVQLKKLLELVLKIYEVMKTNYTLKQESRGLPPEIVMLSLKGMLSWLNRVPNNGNERWEPNRTVQVKFEQNRGSILAILDFLKVQPLRTANPIRV